MVRDSTVSPILLSIAEAYTGSPGRCKRFPSCSVVLFVDRSNCLLRFNGHGFNWHGFRTISLVVV